MNSRDVIIGVDLGTNLGLVVMGRDGTLKHRGTVKLRSGRQVEDLLVQLKPLLTSGKTIVAWEAPFGPHGQVVLQRMAGALIACCTYEGVSDISRNVSEIKKFATGKGNAKKPDMIAAAEERWGGEGWDEHTADAAFAAECVRHQVLNNNQTEGL